MRQICWFLEATKFAVAARPPALDGISCSALAIQVIIGARIKSFNYEFMQIAHIWINPEAYETIATGLPAVRVAIFLMHVTWGLPAYIYVCVCEFIAEGTVLKRFNGQRYVSMQ
jgi:hypothetical protein